ncbi:MAG: dihydrofolate reductase [Micavibrio aeruginosavorus]|uniref:dihydrofolate reductase n=1 Tax=Micavibrio aeruginosavorus TaxID=349221 RepID=A0A2W5BZ36_9BACT|nr:MAG: dihydrofolate reductase [Micavibrio aeruginosavorus]
MSMRKIFGMMAATEQGVVGDKGKTPWDYPEELEMFRAVTAGHVVLMGRKTAEAIPAPFFQKREAIVLTRNPALESPLFRIAHSPEESLALANDVAGGRKIFMIGGAETAHEFLRRGLIDSFILTTIQKAHDGDAVLDLKMLNGWRPIMLRKTANFHVNEFIRPRPAAPVL